jgi:hypothetical protein
MVNMEGASNEINTSNSNRIQLPAPPPYTAVVNKISENDLDRVLPPSYSDIDNQSVTCINNYPGPPLIRDGHGQVVQEDISINYNTTTIKKIHIYLIVNGIMTILFGITAIGIEIGILASNSIIYYYYGFWGGGFLICIGLSTIILYKNSHNVDYDKFFRSFFAQMILTGTTFAVALIIVLTDTCDDNATEDDGQNRSCKHSYKILNSFFMVCFALAFLQAIISVIIFGILKRPHSMTSNSFP